MMDLNFVLAEMKTIIETEGTVNPFVFFKDEHFSNENYADIKRHIKNELFIKFDPIADYETALSNAFEITAEAYYYALAEGNKKIAAGLLCNLYVLKYVELSGPKLVKYQEFLWALRYTFKPLTEYIDSCLG